jgi:hypothetical protein
MKVAVIIEHFPMHDNFKEEIKQSWARYRLPLIWGFITGNYISSMQPLNFIANYYGEKMGFYFAFLTFYTSWLIIPAIPGVALFIYQMWNLQKQFSKGVAIADLSVDTPYNCLYSLIMALWSTIVIEVWKRRQNEIAHLWNATDKIKCEDFQMPEFKADPDIQSNENRVKFINTASSHMRRLYTEIPIVILSIGCVVGCFIGIQIY